MTSAAPGGFKLTKINYRGEAVWIKQYTAATGIGVARMEMLNSNELIICGAIDDPAPNDTDPFYASLDTNGNVNWAHIINTTSVDRINDMKLCGNNSIVMTGNRGLGGSPEGIIFKADFAGNILWSKEFGIFFLRDEFQAIICAPSGAIYVAGITEDYTNGGASMDIVMKLSPTGNLEWLKTYSYTPGINPSNTQAFCIEMSPNGSILVGGFLDNGDWEPHIFNIDTLGNVIWSNTYDQINVAIVYDVRAVDSTIVAVGNSQPSGARMRIFKIRDYGLGCGFTAQRDLVVETRNDTLVNQIWPSIALIIGSNTDSSFIEEADEYLSFNCEDTLYNAELPDPIIYSYTVINDCSGLDTSSITFSGSGGNYILSYSIDGGQTFSFNPMFDSLALGQYPLIVTDGYDTISTDTVTIGNFTVDFGADTTFCAGGLFVLSAPAGALNYTWQDGSSQNTFQVMSAGTYSVVADYGGCIVGDAIVVDITPIPSGNITYTQPNYAAVIFDPNSSPLITDDYLWDFGDGSGDIGQWTQHIYSSSGTYNVCVILSNSCDTVTVCTSVVICLPSSSTTSAAICQGDSILLGGVYQSSAGTFEDTLIGASTTGCDSLVSITLTVLSVTVNPETAEICEGDSILLAGTFQTNAGVYEDIYVGANSCDSMISTTLTVDPLPTVSFNGLDTVYCIDASPSDLTGSPLGGSFSGSGMSGSLFTPSNAGLGTHNITYSYTDPNNCVNTATKNVTITNCTGLNTYESGRFKVYPNPFSLQTIVYLDKPVQDASLTFYDIQGQEVKQLLYISGNSIVVQCDNLPDGMYFIHVIAEGKLIGTEKIILLKE
ncbi:MAG: T9SS type A sorting domain-containing protein [Flavobacteriales bacterium]|nr:T9SS type A sorting domain-containing protein [Flavobacteriales bacterium]